MAADAAKLDTSTITEWRSIVTLIVFVLTSTPQHPSSLKSIQSAELTLE